MNPLRTKNNLISSLASLAQQTRTPNALFQTEGHLYEKLQLLPLCVTEWQWGQTFLSNVSQTLKPLASDAIAGDDPLFSFTYNDWYVLLMTMTLPRLHPRLMKVVNDSSEDEDTGTVSSLDYGTKVKPISIGN